MTLCVCVSNDHGVAGCQAEAATQGALCLGCIEYHLPPPAVPPAPIVLSWAFSSGTTVLVRMPRGSRLDPDELSVLVDSLHGLVGPPVEGKT